jgi:rod shape-determining protein MreC
VKPRTGSGVLRLALPLRGRIHRFTFLFLVLGATALMLLSRTDNVVVERVSAVVIDVFSPIMDVLSRPAASIKELVQTIRGLAHLREENVRLTRENERLLAWQESAHRLAAQNEILQSLLDYKPAPKAHFVTARVIGDSGGAFVRSVLINAGTAQGISKGQAAVTGKGLAGQVVQVGYRSARVLLITDINSRVPVNASVAPGDRVVTSGHGGVFPPGLPVGRITVADDGVLRVAPYFELDRLEYISLVDHVRIQPLVGDHTVGRKVSIR